MPIVLYRIDDRLIHGQVVVGWGQPLDIRLLILVDDLVAGSEWEQELYRMAVPPEMEIRFESLGTIAGNHPNYAGDPRRSILITGDVNTMRQLACKIPEVRKVNLGGLHHRAGRVQKLRYVFLTPQEEQELRDLEHTGIEVTAQDVPSARAHPLSDVLSGEAKP
jgi:Phosphotransferase system, mannose/fructose/N-acetylgalactosamine-specific component IIB